MDVPAVRGRNLTKSFSGRRTGVQLQHTQYDRIAVSAMTLLAVTVICGAVAVKTFRWE